jgi:hypothetical protein
LLRYREGQVSFSEINYRAKPSFLRIKAFIGGQSGLKGFQPTGVNCKKQALHGRNEEMS